MILADVLADYEKQLEAVGEEPEALSFVYRGLKQWDLTHLPYGQSLPQSVG